MATKIIDVQIYRDEPGLFMLGMMSVRIFFDFFLPEQIVWGRLLASAASAHRGRIHASTHPPHPCIRRVDDRSVNR